jgi:ankyrin repeat protein
LEACKLLNEAIIKLLLEKGADINAKNGWGGTPLIVTCQMWRRDTSKLPYTATAVVRLLIEHGADVNAEDKNGKTALSRACQGGGNPQIAELLRRLGAKG